jgi:hypothetical protein
MGDRPDSAQQRRRDDVSLKEYVDQTVAPWSARMVEGDVTLREYIEALLGRDRYTVEYAVAELRRRIRDGDDAILDHVAQEIAQLRAGEGQRELLSLSRKESLDGRIDALRETREREMAAIRREVTLINDASEAAIAKAESATERRFESVNEFRAQLTDTIGRFLPREVSDAQINELRVAIGTLTARVDRMAGNDEGKSSSRTAMTSTAQVSVAALGLLVAVLAIVITVILANGVGP